MKGAPFRLDLFRLRGRRGLWAPAILLIVMTKGGVYLAARLGAFGGIDNGYAYMALSATYSIYLVSFLLCIMAATSISGEYASGILRMFLSRPVSRSAYFLTRALFLILVALLLAALDGLAGTVMGWWGFGFKDVADTALQGPQFSSGAMAFVLFEGYLLTFLGMAALASTGLLVSVILRSPTASLGTAACLFFMMEGVRHIFREPAASLMATRYMGVHMDYLANFARGIAEYREPDYLLKAIAVPLGYILAVNLIGLLFFRRMDVLE